MRASYRQVFASPGGLAFSVTGLVARLPISMMTLGIVLLISQSTGSYGLAGQVSAAYVVGNAVFAVPHGRLVDRLGQRRLLLADSSLFALAGALLLVSILERWALPWPHLCALVTGAAIPQIGSMVRARWAHTLETERELGTAFAVEGIVDEVVFVVGPALVTFLATTWAPQAGLVAALSVGTVGAVALSIQRGTEPPAHPREPGVRRSPMPWMLLGPLAVAALGLGSLFGAVEVATVAVAGDAGRTSFSGLLLGAFALGSLLSGLVTGTRAWWRGPLSRARIGMTLLSVGSVSLPFLVGLPLVAIALFLIGLAVAPTLIALFSLLEASVPRSRLNEALGVVHTGVGAGIAPGVWLAGVVADEYGGLSAYWVCTVAAVVAALAGLAVRVPARQEPSPRIAG